LRIFATEKENGHPTPIPYESDVRGPHPGQGYLNIRRDRALISRLSEVNQISGFSEFLFHLNAPSTVFHTVGTDFGEFDEGTHWRMTSYVQVVFEPLSWNRTRTRYEQLFSALRDHAARRAPGDQNLGIEFQYDPVLFRDFAGMAGWSVTFWVIVLAQTKAELRPASQLAMDFLLSFLLEQNQQLARLVENEAPTVSGLAFHRVSQSESERDEEERSFS
jgi:hypothetical protein